MSKETQPQLFDFAAVIRELRPCLALDQLAEVEVYQPEVVRHWQEWLTPGGKDLIYDHLCQGIGDSKIIVANPDTIGQIGDFLLAIGEEGWSSFLGLLEIELSYLPSLGRVQVLEPEDQIKAFISHLSGATQGEIYQTSGVVSGRLGEYFQQTQKQILVIMDQLNWSGFEEKRRQAEIGIWRNWLAEHGDLVDDLKRAVKDEDSFPQPDQIRKKECSSSLSS